MKIVELSTLKKIKTITFFLALGLLLSMLPLSSESQPIEEEEEIMGLIDPDLDGFIDSESRNGYVSEWGDSRKKSISLRNTESEWSGDLYTKFVSDTLYIGFSTSKAFAGIYLQIDFDQDGSLSQHDILLAGLKPQSATGSLAFNQQTEAPSRAFSGIYIFDGEGTWDPIADFLGLDRNKNYDNVFEPLVGDVVMQNNQRFSKQRQTEFQAEMMFSPGTLIQILQEYSPNTKWEEFQVKDTIDYGILLIDNEYSLYGYPQTIDTSTEIEGLAEFVRGPLLTDLHFFETDVGLDHIEVTQAVQFEDNSLPLVRGKRTLARVFVNNPTGGPVTVQVSLYGYAFALLWILPLGVQSTSFNAPTSPNRNNLADSANFELPSAWENSPYLILKAKVSQVGYIDTNPSDNQKSEMFNFQETYDMNIYYVRLNSGTAASPTQISTTTFNNLRNIFTASYPMANPNFIQLGWESAGIISTSDDHSAISALNNILGNIYLSIVLQILFTGTSTIPIPDQIVGFRVGSGGHSDPHWNNHGAKMAFATVIGNALTTLGHEMNHNIGPNDWGRHVAGSGFGCSAPGSDPTWNSLFSNGNIHALGWLPSTGLIASNTVDFMTYCSSPAAPNAWVSDYRWTRLFNRLKSFTPGSPLLSMLKSSFNLNQEAPSSSRFVSGVIDPENGLSLDPSFVTQGDFGFAPIYENLSPAYFLNVFYSNGTKVIYPIYNEPNSVTLHDGHAEDIGIRGFSFWIPDNGQITKFTLTDPNQNEIFNREDSGFTGSASLSAPLKLERGESNRVQWVYTLSNNTNIFAQLQYSTEKNVWYNIGKPTLGSSMDLNFDDYPGSKEGKFRLLMSDGFKTITSSSQSFTELSDLAPFMEILRNTGVSPDVFSDSELTATQNDVVRAELQGSHGSAFSLIASAYDPETGNMDPTMYSWKIFDESNQQIGGTYFGENFEFNLIDDGIYKVVVSVSDVAGNEASDEVQINIKGTDYLSEDVYQEFVKENNLDKGYTFSTSPSSSKSDSSDKSGKLPIPLNIQSVLLAIIAIPLIRKKRNS